MFRRLFLTLVTAGAACAAVGALFGAWGYYFLVRDLPKLSRIEDYKPPAVTRVLASDGSLMAEFYSERRYPVKLHDVPDVIRKAFLAAEDASFYSHHGIDPVSILRAAVKNFQSGSVKQGASTITQQVVKNLLLSSEQSFVRKGKEAILSYRLERRFSKDEIFEIYLNQIFFGNTAYGIKAAARIYYHKELPEITLGEAAMLAGLPKGPSNLSPIKNPQRARERQAQILTQMVEAKFITEAQRTEALKEPFVAYPATQQNVFSSPYYVGEIRRVFADKWKDLDIDSDGLEIVTAVDTGADRLAQQALRLGLREVDKRRGWRGPIGTTTEAAYLKKYDTLTLEENVPVPAFVRSVQGGVARVFVGKLQYNIDLNEAGWAKKFLEKDDSTHFASPSEMVKPGHLIEVALRRPMGAAPAKGADKTPLRVMLDQTPEIEGAVVLIDPTSGEVRAMAGGYDYSQSQFNRVTQSLRQPGSTFKPIIYLAAIDKYNYTPSTIMMDQARTFRVGDTFWTPANFDEKFLGPITLRTALEKSRNLVSADIVSRIGVDAAIQYARNLGIESPLGRNLSLSLGSSEVTPLELTRAYSVFPAKGVLFDSVFVLQIKDRFGNVLYDYALEKAKSARQVISPNSAFVMANMMKGVIDYGTGYKIKELGRPVAGKTGTSNDQMDTWFIGYTPSWVCGVWVGFDQKKQIGAKETGGVVAAPIWLYFMRDFLEQGKAAAVDGFEREAKAEAERLGIEYVAPQLTEQIDFSVPDGVEPFWINKASGAKLSQGSDGAFLEYFVKGTEPDEQPNLGEDTSEGEHEEASTSSYLESPDL
jgi:penicillin-binding protein 1A